MRTLHRRPLALLVALATLAGPTALLANDLDPAQQPQLDDGLWGGGEPKPCRFGSRVLCGTETTETCIERSVQPTVGPAGVGFSWYCVTKRVTTIMLFKDD